MSEGLIFLKNARLSFPNIAVPKSPEGGGTAKYSADFLLEPNDPVFAKFMEEANKLALAKWGDKASAVLQIIQSDRRLRCFGGGAERIDKKTIRPYNGYEGKVYIAASRNSDKGMPQIIDGNGAGIDPTNTLACQNEARKMLGGYYVNAVVKPWIQDNQYGRGIRCDFIAIQLAAEGELFGEGVRDASSMFAAAPAAAPAWTPPVAAGMPAPPTWGAPAAAPSPPWMTN